MVLLHTTLRKYIFNATDTQFMPERIFEMTKKVKSEKVKLHKMKKT